MTTSGGQPCVWTASPHMQRRQRDDRADRQVDAAGEDHERHADRDDEQERVVDEEVEDDLA